MRIDPAAIFNAVAKAADAVADLMVTVTHEPYASTDSDGKRSYGAGVSRQALKTVQTKAVQRQSGVEAVLGPTLTFVGDVSFDMRDRITLDDGTQPPIVDVSGPGSPTGGTYYTVVKFGRPERGQVT